MNELAKQSTVNEKGGIASFYSLKLRELHFI